MWGALKKDFGEFVSTVAVDATETLQSIDQQLDEPLVRGSKETADESTTEALIDPDTGIPLETGDEDLAEMPWKPPSEASPDDMRDRLVSCEEVFADPLVAEQEEGSSPNPVAAFLESFDVATVTEEISELLKSDAALQTTFSMCSDTVQYTDFWTRYFYRIHEAENLPKTYAVYYQKHLEAVAAKEAEASKAAKSGGITGFLGGVVTRLTNDDDDTDPNQSGMTNESVMTDESTSEDGAVAAARSALGFLSSVAGPLRNTAVSDDEEEEEDGPSGPGATTDEDSEVELGWDDDDDEDFDGLDDDEGNPADNSAIAFEDGDDRSETVDFKDAEKEGLLEELEQARAERDALQKTVEMQAAELAKASQAPAAASVPAPESSTPKASSETEQLKLQLFEKDAELAALKAKMEDDEAVAAAASASHAETEKLQQALDATDTALQSARAEHQTQLEAQKTESDQLVASLRATIAELQTKVVDAATPPPAATTSNKDETVELQAAVASKNAELTELRATLASKDAELSQMRNDVAKATAEAKVAVAAQETLKQQHAEALATQEGSAATLRASTETLQTKVTELSSDLAASQQASNELQTKLAQKETRLAQLSKDSQAMLVEKDEQISTLAKNFSELESEMAEKNTQIEALSASLETSRDALARLQSETEVAKAASAIPPTSPGSISTGVRVDSPVDDAAAEVTALATPSAAASTVPAMPDTPYTTAAESLGLEPSENDVDNDDDDDDGWGDDW